MNEVFYRIDELRRDKGISLKKLSEIVGSTPQNVQRWKSGGTIVPEHLNKLALYFNTTVDYLLTGRAVASVTLTYGIRERLYEAKGATGLCIHGMAQKMGVDAKEVERLMKHGGNTTGAFIDAFEAHMQPVIDLIKAQPDVIDRLREEIRAQKEQLTRANKVIDRLTKGD